MNGSATGPGETQILTVQGELDLTTADSLYRRARAAINRHVRLLLDLTGVSFCDARGLGTRLLAALDELGLAPHNAIAAGDAGNDLALLQPAQVGAAVAKAVPSLAADADLHLGSRNGAAGRDLRRWPAKPREAARTVYLAWAPDDLALLSEAAVFGLVLRLVSSPPRAAGLIRSRRSAPRG
jgi:ABC-type transporter Mla MlaB component